MKNRLRNVITTEPQCWCPDSSCSVSKLTVFNNDELVIENFRHVVYSDEEKVSVKTRKGILNVYGTNMHIEYYTSYEIKISGIISSVDWMTA